MIVWACPTCQAKLRAPETATGRKLPCPKCKSITEVPSGADPATNDPAASGPAKSVPAPQAPTKPAAKVSPLPAPEAIAGSAKTAPIGVASGRSFGLWFLGGVAVAALSLGAVAAAIYVFGSGTKQGNAGEADPLGLAAASGKVDEAQTADPTVPVPGPKAVKPPAEPSPPTGDAPEAGVTSVVALVKGYGEQQIEAKIAFQEGFEDPYHAILQVKRGPNAPKGPFTFTAEAGDCIDGFLLLEPLELAWAPADGLTMAVKVPVLGCRWNQISMFRGGRTQRGGVWKAEALQQLVVRNEELRNAGNAVWQLAVMKIEPEGDFRRHRQEFASTPYEVTQTQWEFADGVLKKLRPIAAQMEKQEKNQARVAKEATAVRIPLVTAIREQRVQPTFRFPKLLESTLAIDFKVASGAENARLEMWVPEATRAVVELKPGQPASYYLCDLQLSTANATKHFQTGVYRWNGLAFSASPVEPEPVVENSLYEYTTAAKKPQFGEIDPIVAHIAAQPQLDVVKKQLAIWIYNNPALSADAVHAIGRKFDDPILSTIPESIMEDARIQVRASRWQVEQLPEDLQQGRITEFFVGEWTPADFLLARSAAVDFQLPSALANPLLPESEIEQFRRQLTLGFGGGIDIEQMSLTLFPDLRFEARGTYLNRPVAARGNWRWTGAGLDFPLWKDGKGNDPFLEDGGRANLPMLLLAHQQVIGEAISPSASPKPHGAFLRKVSSAPSIASSGMVSPKETVNPSPSDDHPLDEALRNVELQKQAAAVDEKNTRVRSLFAAVAEGLVTLKIEVVDPLPKSAHFMHKEAKITIRKASGAERLNLKLSCAAPMQFEFATGNGDQVPAVLATGRPDLVEFPAIQPEVVLTTRCFFLKWEYLNLLKPLENAAPQVPAPAQALLASTYGGAFDIAGGMKEVEAFYAEHWKKILNLREALEKGSKGRDREYSAEDREAWRRGYVFDDVDLLGHMPGFEVDERAREMATAFLFLQHPQWKAEQLLRYAHSKGVRASIGADSQTYLMEEFAPQPDPGQNMKGHLFNFKGFILANYCRELTERLPESLRKSAEPSAPLAHFQGHWKSVTPEKALQLFEQLVPRTAEEHEAKQEQKQRAAQGEALSVGVLPISVALLPDGAFDFRRMREGVEERSSGVWQWDGSQLWIGTHRYFVVDGHLVAIQCDRATVYGTFLERDESMAHSNPPQAEEGPKPADAPAASQSRSGTSAETAKERSDSPAEESAKTLTAKTVAGNWKPAKRDVAVLVRAAVMRRKVEAMFGDGKVKLNPEQEALKSQMRSMALTEAASDLKIPEVELVIEENKTFRFKNNSKGAMEEFNGKWSIKNGRLILVKDKFTQLELELLEGALYGESIAFGELYLSR